MCPVCTVAVGVGLGLSRWLKIDDTISGLWIGAFIISLSAVSAAWARKYIRIPQTFLMIGFIILYLVATFTPLEHWNIIGNPRHAIFGIDKLVFGITAGMIIFSLSHAFHKILKNINHHKSYFPFQKVIIPVWILLLASIVFSLYKIT